MLNLFTFIFIFFIVQQNFAQKPECKNVGEYCINHWECCTNSCLSYLYKCVGSKDPEIQTISNQNLISESLNLNPSGSGIPQNLNYTSLDVLVGNIFADKKQSEKDVNLITNTRFGGEEDKVDSSMEQNSNSTSNDENDNGSVPPCLEIGAKCTRNDQCCSERCHGFLHQCVT